MRGARMLRRGRRLADSRMSETVVVALWGDGIDEDTGESIRVVTELRYEGRARVRYPSYAVAALSPTSQPIAQQDVVVSIPTGSATVFEGDEILVTGSTVDDAIVGRRYTVKGQPMAGQSTAYRITVVEQS